MLARCPDLTKDLTNDLTNDLTDDLTKDLTNDLTDDLKNDLTNDLTNSPSTNKSTNSNKFPIISELSISPIVSTGSSDYSSTRRYVFAFESAYCGADLNRSFSGFSDFDATSLVHGHIDPAISDLVYAHNTSKFTVPLNKRKGGSTNSGSGLSNGISNIDLGTSNSSSKNNTNINNCTCTNTNINNCTNTNINNSKNTTISGRNSVIFSRSSLLQVILRNPQDGSVADIFVIKVDLTDMPADSRTILRQKAYKSKSLSESGTGSVTATFDSAREYLSKFIEIPLKRSYDPESNRQRIVLSGPIKVAFSFNRSNLRFTTPRRSDASAVEPVQKTRTVLQFPLESQKYFSLPLQHSSFKNHDRLRSSSLTTDNSTRSFQHGSLCL